MLLYKPYKAIGYNKPNINTSMLHQNKINPRALYANLKLYRLYHKKYFRKLIKLFAKLLIYFSISSIIILMKQLFINIWRSLKCWVIQ